MDGLKKRLNKAKGKWVDELPHVLWACRTTPMRLTGEMPFSVTYGSETVIPLKTKFPTMRSNQFDESRNGQLLLTSLDLVEEKREIATIKLAHHQQRLK